MATSDSYNSPYPGQRRTEAPLPPLPSSASSATNYQYHPSSPVMSPLDDPSYRPSGRRSDQTLGSINGYYGAGGDYPYQESNHYSDDIPLRQHPSKGNAEPFSPEGLRYNSRGVNNLPDRDHQSGRSPKKKGGPFSQRRPWAVYFITTVQIAVFIAELVKNGKQLPLELHLSQTDSSRCPHENPH